MFKSEVLIPLHNGFRTIYRLWWYLPMRKGLNSIWLQKLAAKKWSCAVGASFPSKSKECPLFFDFFTPPPVSPGQTQFLTISNDSNFHTRLSINNQRHPRQGPYKPSTHSGQSLGLEVGFGVCPFNSDPDWIHLSGQYDSEQVPSQTRGQRSKVSQNRPHIDPRDPRNNNPPG